ncbi:Hsp20/alpha crystallin family protein [Natronococcus wangiae]|uniref:Hsp20/alpha crystallin family protein n=1 Tax=Natronococcus wangiae TaxID=3068275 RepID=UPI00273DA68A|nr:Hsp20/alpha crystallin family protein [Natronococcus sp. AD5]
MSDNPADNPNESGDDRDETHWLTTLLSALERLERNEGSVSGRRRGDRTTLDYNISVDTGLDRSSGGSFDSIRSGDETDGVAERPRKRRRRRTQSDSHHLTANVYDDELVVTADVAGADSEDVTVGFDDSTLVVAVSGSELDRVDVPWRDRTVDATIKNGVLTVTIEPESEPDSATSGGDDR